MKAVILGPQCSGKTTLVKYLRAADPSLPLTEEDELFTKLNGGEYPKNQDHKEKVLRGEVERIVASSDAIIFVTSYCRPEFLERLKASGFKILQLDLSREEFERRNQNRMANEGYEDARVWADEIFGFHQKIRGELVDVEIDASQPVAAVAAATLAALS